MLFRGRAHFLAHTLNVICPRSPCVRQCGLWRSIKSPGNLCCRRRRPSEGGMKQRQQEGREGGMKEGRGRKRQTKWYRWHGGGKGPYPFPSPPSGGFIWREQSWHIFEITSPLPPSLPLHVPSLAGIFNRNRFPITHIDC